MSRNGNEDINWWLVAVVFVGMCFLTVFTAKFHP